MNHPRRDTGWTASPLGVCRSDRETSKNFERGKGFSAFMSGMVASRAVLQRSNNAVLFEQPL